MKCSLPLSLTVGGDGEDRPVEDVHGDVDGVGRGGLTRVDARVGVLDVPDDEARHGAAAGVVLEAVRGHRLGRRRGRCGAGVEEDHLKASQESRTSGQISIFLGRYRVDNVAKRKRKQKLAQHITSKLLHSSACSTIIVSSKLTISFFESLSYHSLAPSRFLKGLF